MGLRYLKLKWATHSLPSTGLCSTFLFWCARPTILTEANKKDLTKFHRKFTSSPPLCPQLDPFPPQDQREGPASTYTLLEKIAGWVSQYLCLLWKSSNFDFHAQAFRPRTGEPRFQEVEGRLEPSGAGTDCWSGHRGFLLGRTSPCDWQ